MISPVKAAVGPEYGKLDDRLSAAIHIRFGLPALTAKTLKRQIKKADTVSAWMEATEIAGFSEDEADRFFGHPSAEIREGLTIAPRPPVEVREEFMRRHAELLGQL